MSIEPIKNEIQSFLSSQQPEVLCITGKWGVGKTYAWNKFLAEAKQRKSIALPRYAYVSLFGLNALDELRYSVFENSVSSLDIGVEPSLDTLQSNTSAVLKQIGRKSLRVLQQTPALRTYLGGLGPAWFLSVSSTIICIDDIERRGEGLAIKDVFGLISQLKERKLCKVVLITNEDAIEKDQNEFRLYFEKVVDTKLKFEPTAAESVRIALDPESFSDGLLAENCISLGISNIRVIKKIQRLTRKAETILQGFDSQVTRQAIHSLTLFGWSLCEPAVAPPLEYVRKRGSVDRLLRKDEVVSTQEAGWNRQLDAYRFGALDQFDAALLAGVETGFFDEPRVRKHGSDLDRSIKSQALDNSFFRAWEMYHNSLDNDETEVLDAIYKSFMENAARVSPTNLNGTVGLFKEFGREKQAADMIQRYVESRAQDKSAFDLEGDPFGDNVDDPDVVKALKTKHQGFKDERSPKEILLTIAERHGWSQEEIATLATATLDQYYDLFKTSKGEDLRRVINSSLQFETMQPASDSMKEISRKAKDALRRIAGESRINARRLKRYGITPASSADARENTT